MTTTTPHDCRRPIIASVAMPADTEATGTDGRDLELTESRRFVLLVAELAPSHPEELGAADVTIGLVWGWKLYHVPNGGGRSRREGEELRDLGVRQGVPDYALDLPRYDPVQDRLYCGWRGELKRVYGGDVKHVQHAFLDSLRRAGYRAEVWHGADAMLRDLTWYLSLSPLSPLNVRNWKEPTQ